ncbi:MAG: 3-hydroxyacyl-ACP dehydratase FabZ [Kiritimatiellaeota bacterium]|nr:3-hydroxyacyl-ACP dehydratase FabZ [Kiritimatiellota bacterium]
MPTIKSEEIPSILPHRYPMLMVDKVLDYAVNDYIVGLKNVSFNEPFFAGHFPGHPVMPGVLELEAMAQLSGILLNRSINREGQIAYFMSVDNARFRRLVGPGDQLRMEIKVLKYRLGMYKVHGVATVDGEVACEADMMFAIKQEA